MKLVAEYLSIELKLKNTSLFLADNLKHMKRFAALAASSSFSQCTDNNHL